MFWIHLCGFFRKFARTTPTHPQGSSVAEQWSALFEAHRDVLAAVAELLMDGPCSASLVLLNAERKLLEQTMPREFRYSYAIRTVALAALAMHVSDECLDGFDLFGCKIDQLACFVAELKSFPLLERAVLFFREVLRYSRHEIALLLHISDLEVDELILSIRARVLLKGTLPVDLIGWYFRDRDVFGPSVVQIVPSKESSEPSLSPDAPLAEDVA